MTKKTDNANLKSKLDLRRYFLAKYHADNQARVCDCCMGSGVLWKTLKREFPIRRYIGLDVKPKKGRLKIDSVRYLANGDWLHDVIDIDTYGAPWAHYEQVLKFGTCDMTVFLTVGCVKVKGGRLSNIVKKRLGLDKLKSIPFSMGAKFLDDEVEWAIPMAADFGFSIMECIEAERGKHARYIGVRLRKDVTKCTDNGSI